MTQDTDDINIGDELDQVVDFFKKGSIDTLLLVATGPNVGDIFLVEDRHKGGSPHAVGLLEMLKMSYIYGNLSDD